PPPPPPGAPPPPPACPPPPCPPPCCASAGPALSSAADRAATSSARGERIFVNMMLLLCAGANGRGAIIHIRSGRLLAEEHLDLGGRERAQPEIRRADQLGQLPRPPGAHDGACHRLVAQHPGEGDLAGRAAVA